MNRFQNYRMSEGQLIESHNICDLIYAQMREARGLRNYKKELQAVDNLYERIFERFLKGPTENRPRELKELEELKGISYELMLKLNQWEETA
jgi:hypothetical protein